VITEGDIKIENDGTVFFLMDVPVWDADGYITSKTEKKWIADLDATRAVKLDRDSRRARA
jgi:hypothetical protein